MDLLNRDADQAQQPSPDLESVREESLEILKLREENAKMNAAITKAAEEGLNHD